MKLPFDQIYSRKTGKINQKAFKIFVMVALALLALELTYIAYSILNPPLNREDIYGTWVEIGGQQSKLSYSLSAAQVSTKTITSSLLILSLMVIR